MKRLFFTLLKVGISLCLVIFFLHQVGWPQLKSALDSVRREQWAIAVALFGVSNLLGAFQWRELLSTQEIRFPVRTIISLYLVGVFFNNFLIGNIGGDAIRIYDLNRLTGKGLGGFAATFLDRFIGLFTLSCFATFAYYFGGGLRSPDLEIFVLLLNVTLLGVLCFGFSRRVSGVLLTKCTRILPLEAIRVMEDVRKSFLLYRHAHGVLFRAGMLALGVQICRIAVYYTVGEALGQKVAFTNYLVFIPLIAIVAAVPVSIGGIGVRENMGALLFGRVGMHPASALALMFLGYLACIVASVAGGIVFALRRARVLSGGKF